MCFQRRELAEHVRRVHAGVEFGMFPRHTSPFPIEGTSLPLEETLQQLILADGYIRRRKATSASEILADAW